MRTKILYIGNQLSIHGLPISMIETLGPLLEERYEVVKASSLKNPVWRLLDMVYTFLRERREVQMVLIDTFSSLAFYFTCAIALLARFYNKPFIPILHGGNLPQRLQRSPLLSKWVFGHSFTNIAPSGYLHQAFSTAGFHTQLIPNYIHINLYAFQSRPNVSPRLLWVRAFHHTYNPEMAIRVVASLAPSYPAIQLCMVGPDKDGSMERCKQLAVELGVADRIVFTGLLSKAEWIALSADYDIFINTTNFDNTPVSVIEAMALGLPVVSTDVGGMPHLINHGQDGWLIPQGDEKAFAAHVAFTRTSRPCIPTQPKSPAESGTVRLGGGKETVV